jgi:hypothetical protein
MPKIFQTEKDLILATLDQRLLISNTSVIAAIPGIAAKPIIDCVDRTSSRRRTADLLAEIIINLILLLQSDIIMSKMNYCNIICLVAYADRIDFGKAIVIQNYLIQHHDGS